MPDDSPSQGRRKHHGLEAAGRRLLHPFSNRGDRAASAPDHAIARLPREVTLENAKRIGQHFRELLGSGPTVLEIDLTEVTHLSPDGGAAFLMVLEKAQRQGTRLIATHAGPQVRRTLRQLGLTRVIDVFDGSSPGDSARPPSGGGEQ